MPQAVSLFPSPPPQSNSSSNNHPNPETTSSSFDDVLNGANAKQQDSSTAAQPADSSRKAPDKAEKPTKGKTSKATGAKPADAKGNGKTKVGPAPADTDEEIVIESPVAETPASESPEATTKPKIKVATKPEQNLLPAVKVDSKLAQPLVLPSKPQADLSEHGSAPEEEDQQSDGKPKTQGIPSGDEAVDPQATIDAQGPSTGPSPSTAVSTKSAKPVLNPTTPDQTAQGVVGIQAATPTTTTGVSAGRADASVASTPIDDSGDPSPTDAVTIDAKAPVAAPHHSFADVFGVAQGPAPIPTNSGAPSAHITAAPAPRSTPDAQFAEANHSNIVTSVHSTLLPNGGSMQIKLNPPDLGAMDISVQMRNGTMTATFDTTSDQASRMLSHSLGQLKAALEGQGITVGALHVQQSPRGSETSSNSSHDDGKSQGNANDTSAQQQEQQRKDMLKRMWAKLSGDADPLDLVA